MRIYEKSEGRAYYCGHWNGSPLEIGDALLSAVPHGEVSHHHPYHEYYILLEGAAMLEVEGQTFEIKAGQVVMVEPGEKHRVVSISEQGVRWLIVKERSEPNSKVVSADAL